MCAVLIQYFQPIICIVLLGWWTCMNHNIRDFSLCLFNEFLSRETMFLSVSTEQFNFKAEYVWNSSQVLIVGGSLSRKFHMEQIDKLYFPGARSDDIRRIVDRYTIIILFYGGNGVNDFPKNGSMRYALTPGEILMDVTSVCDMLSPRRLFFLCCPLRTNGTDWRLKE